MTYHENGPSIQPQEEQYQEYEVPPQEEGPLVQHQGNSVLPQEEIPFFGHQDYGVTSQENDSLIQEKNVPPHVKDAFLQNQELYQQFNIATPGADLLYQQYNVPPYEQNYLLQGQEHYQYPPHQLSRSGAISSQYGLSQPQYMLPASQMFPIQSQSPGLYTYLFNYVVKYNSCNVTRESFYGTLFQNPGKNFVEGTIGFYTVDNLAMAWLFVTNTLWN